MRPLGVCNMDDEMTDKTEVPFKRELRYYVIKYKDAEKYLTVEQQQQLSRIRDDIAYGREQLDDKPELLAVVVESDWPEYEPVWKMIEARMTGRQPDAILRESAQPDETITIAATQTTTKE